jgi:hypothetical protein
MVENSILVPYWLAARLFLPETPFREQFPETGEYTGFQSSGRESILSRREHSTYDPMEISTFISDILRMV